MPRTCSICTHAERAAINAALLAGTALRDIAGQFGVSKSSLDRHKEEHLPVALVQAKDAEAAAHADDLLAQLATLQADARRIGARAEREGDLRTALAAVRELVRMIELLAEMQGELNRAPQVNITLTAEWLTLRLVILEALAAYPAARLAVAERLALVEGGQ